MPAVMLNYWAILVAAVASMLLGWVYYAMPVMGRRWMTLIGKTQEDLKKGAGPAMALALVAALVTSYVLAHFIQYVGADTWVMGLETGFWVWLGFEATTSFVDNNFTMRPKQLWLIQTVHHLLVALLMGVILAVWQ